MSAKKPINHRITNYVELPHGCTPTDIIEIIRPYADKCNPGDEIEVKFSRPLSDEERQYVCRHNYGLFPKYSPVLIIVLENGEDGLTIEGFERGPTPGPPFFEL